MERKITVSIQIEVTCGGSWGDNCTIAQVKKQAKDEAERIIAKSIMNNPLITDYKLGDVFLTTGL